MKIYSIKLVSVRLFTKEIIILKYPVMPTLRSSVSLRFTILVEIDIATEINMTMDLLY